MLLLIYTNLNRLIYNNIFTFKAGGGILNLEYNKVMKNGVWIKNLE